MSDAALPYDQVVIAVHNAPDQRLSADEFQALPLHQRIRSILEKKVRFYKAGAEIPAAQALRNH